MQAQIGVDLAKVYKENRPRFVNIFRQAISPNYPSPSLAARCLEIDESAFEILGDFNSYLETAAVNCALLLDKEHTANEGLAVFDGLMKLFESLTASDPELRQSQLPKFAKLLLPHAHWRDEAIKRHEVFFREAGAALGRENLYLNFALVDNNDSHGAYDQTLGTLKLLESLGAKISRNKEGQTALMVAARFKSPSALRAFVDHFSDKISVNAVCHEGENMLFEAVRSAHRHESVAIVAEAGVKATWRNRHGKTVLIDCVERGNIAGAMALLSSYKLHPSDLRCAVDEVSNKGGEFHTLLKSHLAMATINQVMERPGSMNPKPL